jgi:hypothetical protein
MKSTSVTSEGRGDRRGPRIQAPQERHSEKTHAAHGAFENVSFQNAHGQLSNAQPANGDGRDACHAVGGVAAARELPLARANAYTRGRFSIERDAGGAGVDYEGNTDTADFAVCPEVSLPVRSQYDSASIPSCDDGAWTDAEIADALSFPVAEGSSLQVIIIAARMPKIRITRALPIAHRSGLSESCQLSLIVRSQKFLPRLTI